MLFKPMLAALAMTAMAAPAFAQDSSDVPARSDRMERHERMEKGEKMRMSPSDRAEHTFEMMDKDGDGTLSREEYVEGVEAIYEHHRGMMEKRGERREDRAERREDRGGNHLDKVWRDRGQWGKTETGKEMPAEDAMDDEG